MMNTTTDQIMDAALGLPETDRVELAEALLASLQPTDRPPFPESWRAVIARRSDELRTGRVQAIPWTEVKRRARERDGA
jgi:putative addiction module component (TIGR02574 family)